MKFDRLTVDRGNRYTAYMPFSEACMWMKVAGKRMWFEVVGNEYPMVQLYNRDKDYKLQLFSFPITLGEAGVFQDSDGMYCYPMANCSSETVV